MRMVRPWWKAEQMQDRDRDRLRAVFGAKADLQPDSVWPARVCRVVVAVVNGVDGAAVTLRSATRAEEMLGVSDQWAAGLEERQYTLGEGPGVQAFSDGEPVLVADLRTEENRWPGFAEAAGAAGVTAMFAFPLQVGAIRIGTLDLYRRSPGQLSSTERADAAVLADLITLSLMERAESSPEWDLGRPASSYQDVNVATGVVAAELRISLDDAFARLRAHAFAQNRSIVDVARDVVARRLRLDLPDQPRD